MFVLFIKEATASLISCCVANIACFLYINTPKQDFSGIDLIILYPILLYLFLFVAFLKIPLGATKE